MHAAPGRGARDLVWSGYLRRCAEGDQSALAHLYEESSRYVYGMALRILRDAADAEEITVDVFSQVWRSAATFSQQRGSALNWLITLARSRSIDRLRTQSAQVRRREEPLEPSISCAGSNPEQSAVSRQQRARIQSALDQLNPEQRELLELGYFGGLSHSELATQLNQPLGTVKTRIRFGMIRLRELLSDYPQR
jgi:RNA polymerase sigma-70 factor, ECF subfamily